MHIGETSFYAVVVKRQPRVIDAQQVQSRCVQVVTVGRMLDSLVTKFIGGTVTDSAFDTAAGKPCRKSSGVMVATFRLIRLVPQADDQTPSCR